jgi:hypothetical protein
VAPLSISSRSSRARLADEKEDTSKPAFAFKREDINSISLTRAGQTMTIDNENNQWTIKQPVNARADESAVSSLTSEIASAKVERTLPANSGDTKSYGLDSPQVTLGIKLKNGEQHTLKLGAKDFSGMSVYGQIDSAKDVAMLPVSAAHKFRQTDRRSARQVAARVDSI